MDSVRYTVHSHDSWVVEEYGLRSRTEITRKSAIQYNNPQP